MADPLVEQKIDSLIRCITRIEKKRPATYEILENDIDLQDIISVNIERAVQQCVDIAMICISNSNAEVPATMGEAFDVLATQGIISEKVCTSMRNAVEFRNLIVHAYRKIDWHIVWNILENELGDFRGFAAEIMKVSQ